MFYNVVIDVFIGLIFIYLLYSLLATVLMELIARWFNLRARMLMRGLRRMLEDHVSVKGNWFQRSTVYNYIAEMWNYVYRFFMPMNKNEKLVKRFYDQPSIKYLGEDKAFSKPGYLQPHNFSNTIVQMLRGNEYDGSTNNEAAFIKNALDNNSLNINRETLSHLKNLFADARQDVYVFRMRLEQWFEETMERANGWYKRQTQIILILIGFFIAWQFNVDSIAISKILLKDKKVREQMVQLAISKQESYEKMQTSLNDTTRRSDSSFIQNKQPVDSAYNVLKEDAANTQNILGLRDDNNPYQKRRSLKWFGWLITALAISMGAPFWFDMLNRVVKLRSTGTRPATGQSSSSSMPSGTSEGKNIRG